MKSHRCDQTCSAGDSASLDRRFFLKTVAGVSAAAFTGQSFASGLFAGSALEQTAETFVGDFYKTLSSDQKSVLCLPFEHELRSRINANWHVTKPQIGEDFFTAAQRDIIRRILQGITSEEGYDRLKKQMDEDSGGIEYFSVAVFGEPGNGKFEFELTGRHLTLRADGNSVDHAAFGGPIVYGHGEEDAKKNMYYYQTEQTDKVFRSLNADQAQNAVVSTAPVENAVAVQGEKGMFPGIRVGTLATEQQQLVRETLAVLLAPFRKSDVDEVMQIVADSGGVEKLHMAFYQQDDLNNDKQWDIWRVEGPSFVWHFRGAPHVHAYINIGHVKS